MNIENLALQDLMITIYGVVVEGLNLQFEDGSAFSGLTPVLIKGWGRKEKCVAVSERRVLLLSGEGEDAVGCGWETPIKMWRVSLSQTTIALDIQGGSIDRLIPNIYTSSLVPSQKVDGLFDPDQTEVRSGEITQETTPIDDLTAQRFEKFLSDESLFKSTSWVAHQGNNNL